MYKLILYQVKSGWMWKITYTRGGPVTKILGKSGQSYKNKWHAKRAYDKFMELRDSVEED